MKNTDKMIAEITKKRRMTDIVKNKLYKRIFYNALLASGLIVYIILIDIAFIELNQETLVVAFKVFPIISILFTIMVFEMAYRKENGKIAIIRN